MGRLANSSAAPPSLSTSDEDTARLGFEAGESAFMTNYTFAYASAQDEAPEIGKNMGFARFPRVDAEPAEQAAAGRLQPRGQLLLGEQGRRLRGGRLPGQRQEPADRGRTRRAAALALGPLHEQSRDQGLPRLRRAGQGIDRGLGPAADDARLPGRQPRRAARPPPAGQDRPRRRRLRSTTNCGPTSKTRSSGKGCSDGGARGHRRQRADPLRAPPRLAALRAGGARDAGRHRLPDRLRDRPLAAADRPALPRRGRLRRPRQLHLRAQLRALVDRPLQHRLPDGHLGRDRARPGDGDRAGHAPGDLRPRRRPHRGPDPLRDHHRGRGLRLAVRLRPGHRLRQQPAADRRRHGLVRRPLQLLRRDHHGRGLEDDAVHGAAAARRAGDDRRPALRGGEGRRAPAPGSASPASPCR